jgi:hypothetical protein
MMNYLFSLLVLINMTLSGEIYEGYTVMKIRPPLIKLGPGFYPRQMAGTRIDPFLCLPDYRVVERVGIGYVNKNWKPTRMNRSQYNAYIKYQNSFCWLPVMRRK